LGQPGDRRLGDRREDRRLGRGELKGVQKVRGTPSSEHATRTAFDAHFGWSERSERGLKREGKVRG
jgi:hypothetical protein